MSRPPSALTRVERATVQMMTKGGRGVLVCGGYVLTATHCIGQVDFRGRAALGDYDYEKARAANGLDLVLQVVAAEPLSDIAALECPDPDEPSKGVDAWKRWFKRTKPVPLYRGDFDTVNPPPNPGYPLPPRYELPVWILNRDGSWVQATGRRCTPRGDSAVLEYHTETNIEGGASGGPVVTPEGDLVGIVSKGCDRVERFAGREVFTGHAACALYALPAWLVKKMTRRQRRVRP